MRRDPVLGTAIKKIGACGMAERQRTDHLSGKERDESTRLSPRFVDSCWLTMAADERAEMIGPLALRHAASADFLDRCSKQPDRGASTGVVLSGKPSGVSEVAPCPPKLGLSSFERRRVISSTRSTWTRA